MNEWKKWSVASGLFMIASVSAVHAADAAYPVRPVRLIVPYPPGGSTDPTARAYGGWLSDKFGVQFTHVPEYKKWGEVVRAIDLQIN